MNKLRRQALAAIQEKLEELKDELDILRGEETDYRDYMPENFQNSERYEKADEAVCQLEDAVTHLVDAISNIDAAIE